MLQNFPGRRALLDDAPYRGPRRITPYFEGWYFRQVTADRSESLAVIVGMSLSPDPHAFVQILNGPDGRVLKKRYPLEAFRAWRDRFEVTLGENRFSTDALVLGMDVSGVEVTGRLEFSDRAVYPTSFVSPTIMGPFSWAPFMECIHGLVSMDHRVSGSVAWNGRTADYTGGRGYIEKDRGRSMPRHWIWCHTNQFETEGDSLMLSVARIPWLGSSFTGHLGFLRFGDNLHRFGTYTGSRVSGRKTERGLELAFTRRRTVLEVILEPEGVGGSLDAPVDGAMSRQIVESPWSRLEARLTDGGSLLWEGRAEPAAVEVTGDVGELLPAGT